MGAIADVVVVILVVLLAALALLATLTLVVWLARRVIREEQAERLHHLTRRPSMSKSPYSPKQKKEMLERTARFEGDQV